MKTVGSIDRPAIVDDKYALSVSHLIPSPFFLALLCIPVARGRETINQPAQSRDSSPALWLIHYETLIKFPDINIPTTPRFFSLHVSIPSSLSSVFLHSFIWYCVYLIFWNSSTNPQAQLVSWASLDRAKSVLDRRKFSRKVFLAQTWI